MKCHRCGYFMSYEKFYSGSESFFGWRCLACGDIIDQVVLENRLPEKRLLEEEGLKRPASSE